MLSSSLSNPTSTPKPTHPQPQSSAQQTKKRARFATPDVQSEDFALLSSPHPYGILPGGNRFLDGERSKKRDSAGVKSPSSIISDECWYHVLGFCSGHDLGRLIQTCRYFYATGSEPELWRDLVLMEKADKVIKSAGPTWKDAYVQMHLRDAESNITFQPHKPMPVSGVFSDYYYRLHTCRSFAIPDAWLDTRSDTVDRIPYDVMTDQMFEDKFERENRPVVIEGAARKWGAFRNWQNFKYMLHHSGPDKSFRATSGAAALPGQFSFQAYYDYCRSVHLEEAPLYLFDRTALAPGTHLWNDYMEDLKTTCPYWDPDRKGVNHDLFKVLGEGKRPDHTWLICGPKRSGSVFHIDPNATHAWNAAIMGRKKWIFYPPGVTPPGVMPSKDADEVALPLSLGEWLFQFWNEHVDRKRTAPVDERPLECLAEPGDLVFVPHGWWHLVVNLDKFNIAVTHNYVSGTNLASVLKFLDQKRDQISGCRDRDESIKPELLYEEFVEALRKTHPDLVKKAVEDPNWNCRAWKHAPGPYDNANEDEWKPNTSGTSNSCTKASVMSRAACDSGFSFSFM